MLEGRQIENIVILTIGLDKRVILERADIQSKGLKISVDIPQRTADVANQFDDVVFTNINNMQFFGCRLKISRVTA